MQKQLLVIGVLLAATGAQACISQQARGQTVVLAAVDNARTRLPAEHSIAPGDLLAVLVPKGAKVKILDAKGAATDAVQALDAERYKELSAQGRGRVPVEVSTLQMTSRQWLYFGAARAGVVYVDVQATGGRELLRVNIEQPKTAPRGEVITLTDAQQDKPQPLTMFDTLELELPGSPGDGWTTSMTSGTATIRSITSVSAPAGTAPRVRIRFDLQQQDREQVLEVKRGAAAWRYTLQSRAMPAC